MPQSSGSQLPTRNLQVGHSHLDTTTGLIFRYLGSGDPSNVLNWIVDGGEANTDPDSGSWGSAQNGANWFARDLGQARRFNDGSVTSGTQGPQGPQGDTGPQGPQGPQGDSGVNGAWTLVSNTAISGVSSFDLEAFDNLGYEALQIHLMQLTPSADGTNVTALFKLNGAYKTDANYRWKVFSRTTSSTSTNEENNNTDTSLHISSSGATWGLGNATLENTQFNLFIGRPDNTAKPKLLYFNAQSGAPSGAHTQNDGMGTFDGTDAANRLEGIRIAINTGTMSCTAIVLGLVGS